MEEKKIKRIGAYKILSDETLKRETKADLIELIRILEHNWSCTEESFNNSVKNSDKIFAEQKAEIERQRAINNSLVSENYGLKKETAELKSDIKELEKNFAIQRDKKVELFKTVNDVNDLNTKLHNKSIELQKQVDELRASREIQINELHEQHAFVADEIKQQAVKDKVEKFAERLKDEYLPIISGYFSDDEKEEEQGLNYWLCNLTDEIAKEITEGKE